MASKPLAVTNGKIILPTEVVEGQTLFVANGRIERIAKGNPISSDTRVLDANGDFVSPGFVDIHVHGGAGSDFMDADELAFFKILRCHAEHGTTTIFPTTTTGSPAQIEAMLAATRRTLADWEPACGARIGGVHLYGPFFAPDKVGCHDPLGRRDPTSDEFLRYFDSGLIRIATCAAELPNAAEFYRAAHEANCLITCGHSNATWQEMEAAYELGMRHVDHFWCAMSSVASLRTRYGTPMQASMEQFVLAKPEMSTELIADGYHLSDELLRFGWQMKGPKRLCLVTDSSRALDMPPGNYRFGSRADGPLFRHDGQVGRTLDGSGLASSASGMDHMVRTMARATKAPIFEVIRMASLTPTELVGLEGDYGSLEQGKRADFVLLDKEFKVRSVFIGGERV